MATFAAAVTPILFALFEEARWGSCRALPHGDEAMLEIHLRQAVHGRHLLGPYSQYGWYHPGPLYYYVLAPFYALGGGASRSLNVAVALINLAAVAGISTLHVKLEKGRVGRLLGALVIAAFCSALATRVPEGALVTNPLIEIWNPLVTILPFGLFVFTNAALALGHLGLAPLAVLLHAFVIQTHVSYAPPATLLLAGAFAWAAWQRTASNPRILRALGIAVAVVFVAWLPPLVALVASQRGNAREVLEFAVSDGRQRVAPLAALAYGIRQLQAPLLYWLRFDIGSGTAFAATVTAVELVACAACLTSTARRARPYPAVLAAATSLLTLVALVQSLAIVSLREQTFYYQTLWFSLVGCLGWYAVPYGLGVLRRGRAAAVVSFAFVALPAAAWTLAFFALSAVTRDFTRCRERTPARPEATETALPVLTALFDPHRHPRPKYVLDTSNAGPGLPTVMLELEKHGIEPLVSADWITRLGNGARYGYEGQPGLHVSRMPSHEYPLWRGLGNADIYADDVGRRTTLRAPAVSNYPSVTDRSGERRPAARSRHHRGKRRRRVESEAEPPSDIPIVVGFAAVEPAAGFMAGVRMKGLARGEYVVEGSKDGVAFVRLGLSEATRAPGIRWRSFYFNDGHAWPFVRITATDGAPHVTDVAAIVRAGRLIDVAATPNASGTLETALDGGRQYDLTLSLQTQPSLPVSTRLHLICAGERLGALELLPGALQNHTIVVPARCAGPKTALHLELVQAGSTDVRGAVELRGSWLEPTELTP